MEKTFRLYNRLSSSYFDLISGDKETQQTKGLGLLLAKSHLALKTFLELPAISNRTGGINLRKVDRLIVNSELVSKSENKFRADIILRLYVKSKPYKAFLIEAKSANKGTSVDQTNRQLEAYLDKQSFSELNEFQNQVYAITLTKYSSFVTQTKLISITWTDLIKAFYMKLKNDELLNDYFYFLTNINGVMKFYEREVFSIPTREWSSEAISKFHIYECPNSGRYLIKYKPLFLTFRSSGGGAMERLYKVDEIILLNFNTDLATFIKPEKNHSSYEIEIRRRVKAYSDYMLKVGRWKKLPNDEKQVFILSENAIELSNKPKPIRNNSFRAYYELADLLNKSVV